MLDDFPWVDSGIINGALKQFFKHNDTAAGIEKQAGEDFVGIVP